MSEQNSDFDDHEFRKCAEDANDADFVPPSGKTKTRNRKSSAGSRRIQYPWKHEEIVSLIGAVEKRHGLWDVGSDEYKLSKFNLWREVCDELGFQIDSKEAKFKWSSLRVSFKVNLANYRKKKSRQGADESSTVPWRYFQSMLFLEANELSQSTESMSTMELPSAVNVTDQSGLNDFCESTESTTSDRRGRRKRRNVTATPTPPVSPVPLTNSFRPAKLNALETSDRNSTFCSYLLSELKSLPEAKALDLRRALNQTLWSFLDNEQMQLSTIQLSPVQLKSEF